MQTQTNEYETVEIEPSVAARHAIIWLHGLGADGHDFEPIVPELRLPGALAVRFIFPNAPIRPVAMNGGQPMRAWFDLTGLDRQARVDFKGLNESDEMLRALIKRENARGIPSEHIVLAGFSQGGAVALHTAPRYPERLAGLMVLSSFGLTISSLAEEASPANRELPVFMAHGRLDPVVVPGLGEAGRDTLKAAGYPITWREYSMAHAVCAEEIRDVREWLVKCLNRSS